MYKARQFATKHARLYEALYNASSPIILSLLRGVKMLTRDKLDRPITWVEKRVKGFMFDCQMCGNCVLLTTGMTCPMNCPKTLRNGPCGGVRENGNCEVKPDMKCVWVEAWNGSIKMKDNTKIQDIQFAVNNDHKDTSAWIRLAREGK
ncbi:MAG: methylenetetrahydrofolate reductase C-terminal domain-containing protein [Gammaproteobacteria bacterium]|nr:methylenetetrahydrofolate reductase C-terminal domain-containing protein [Gammaproteobacteria bacterium]